MKRKPFAFISYSRKDVEVAKYLQDRIEKYVYQKDFVSECNRPEDEKRVRPIFLDLTDLSAQVRDFSTELKENLESSRYLIVICSSNSAKSPFVRTEIDHFLATHNNDINLIVPVYVDSVLSGMHPQIDTILSTRNCPIFITGKGTAGHVGRQYCFYHVMEFLLKVDFDKLFNRYEEYKKRKTRIRTTILSIVLLILFGSISYGWYKQYRATQVEHDLAQFEKETFPFSLVVGYVDNFLSPTLEALKDSLKPVVPHIVVMMPNSYQKLDEQVRKHHFKEIQQAMQRYYGFECFVTEEVKIQSRRRASSIVRVHMTKIDTPVYQDFASTVKAIKTVVDYKFDVDRHEVKIDTTAVSRDELAQEYALKFVHQAKERLGADSTLVHFAFSPEEFLKALSDIKQFKK